MNKLETSSLFLFSDGGIDLISPIYRLVALTTVFIALATAFIAPKSIFITNEVGRRGDKDGHPGKKLCTSREEGLKRVLA